MRRTRALIVLAAVGLSALGAHAHESCGCRGSLVLNGRLNTADFDGGVGDRFGDGGASGGGGYAYAAGDGAAAGFARGSAVAFASAHASAFSHSSISAHFGGHGMMHG